MKTLTATALGLSMSALALAAAPVVAQDDVLINVDLTEITDDLALELGVDTGEIPVAIDLSASLAAEVCGVEEGNLTEGDTCIATTITDPLIVDLGGDPDDDEGDDADDGNGADEDEGNASENSAREFAPGQKDGHARDFAPGQQDGPARDFAPGQVKKDNGDD